MEAIYPDLEATRYGAVETTAEGMVFAEKLADCGTSIAIFGTASHWNTAAILMAAQHIAEKYELDNSSTPHDRQIAHFVDCSLNGTECIVRPWQAVEVMKLICAIYESAETGKEIQF